jgi:methionyl-tRNA formyltransferase
LSRGFEVETVILERPISRWTLVRRRAARVGVIRLIDQLAFLLLVPPILRILARRRLDELRARLGADRSVPADRIVHVESVNADACVAELRRRSPSVVVVSGTRIIHRAVLAELAVPVINVHAGITPRYRGVHGAYWALAEGRPASAGVTVHLIDAGIDTGGILGQATIEPQPDDSFVTYPYLQLEAGLPLLDAAVGAALRGSLETVPSLDASESVLRYHPGIVGYLRGRLRRGVR